MTYSFDDASAAERRTTQYFEMFCNRGIYHEGWTAVTRHGIPWMATEMPAFADDVWELYGPDDWTQAHDLAAEQPEKLAELQRLFLDEAAKYNVLPLDDRRFERFNPDLAGRPQLVHGSSQLLFGGMGRLSENSVITMKNKSHAITAEIDVPEGGANGVIISQGGAFGGWRLYAKDGKPKYCYNLFGLQQFKVYGETAIPAGQAPGADGVRLRRRRAGQGRRRHALSSMANRSARVASRATVPMLFSATRRPMSGRDTATPVSDDYRLQRQPRSPASSLGADRHRRGRRGPRPPDLAGGAAARSRWPGSSVAGSCCAPSSGRPLQRRPQAVFAAGGRTAVNLVRLDGGVFTMGSEDRWAYPEDGEGPVKEVEVSAFSIGAYAVSNADFSRFVEETGYATDAERFGWSFVFAGLLPDDFPPTRRRRARALVAEGRRRRLAASRGTRTRRSPSGPTTRSSTSPGTTRTRTAPGRGHGFPPRRSGSSPPAAGWRGRRTPGATSSSPAASTG